MANDDVFNIDDDPFPPFPPPGSPGDPFEQQPNDLPDLETLVWKLVRTPLFGTEAFEVDELEYIDHMQQAACPTCGGTGQDGMTREGAPIECKTCHGRGR